MDNSALLKLSQSLQEQADAAKKIAESSSASEKSKCSVDSCFSRKDGISMSVYSFI